MQFCDNYGIISHIKYNLHWGIKPAHNIHYVCNNIFDCPATC